MPVGLPNLYFFNLRQHLGKPYGFPKPVFNYDVLTHWQQVPLIRQAKNIQRSTGAKIDFP